jgi:glycosyltransferase involved in cell wall biosynthesis
VRPDDPEALAQAGERLLADPARAQKQIELGVKHVREHFPMRAMIDRVEELHENLAQAPVT